MDKALGFENILFLKWILQTRTFLCSNSIGLSYKSHFAYLISHSP